MNNKQELGQFNTTRKDYILDGFLKFVKKSQCWIDPFAGNGDLLEWVKKSAESIEGYDIDPKKKWTIQDTLANPPIYVDKWVIANPPYLALNKIKSKNKSLFKHHKQDDLYKIAIKTVCDGNAEGGIFIVPLNFLCSEQAKSIRCLFFGKFKIEKCKVFEEAVFDDTDYTVCAFYYVKKNEQTQSDVVEVEFVGTNSESISFNISKKYGWILGEEFRKWLKNNSTQGVCRWTEDNARQDKKETGEERDNSCRDRNKVCINDFSDKKDNKKRYIFWVKKDKISMPKYIDVLCDECDEDCKQQAIVKFKEKYPEENYDGEPICLSFEYFKPEVLNNIILIEAIDTGTKDGMLGLKDIRPIAQAFGHKPLLAGLPSSRNKAHVKFDSPPSIADQERIIDYVNEKLSYYRKKYHSIFLTAYRNSTKECSRKRIGFDVVYKMINKARQELNI